MTDRQEFRWEDIKAQISEALLHTNVKPANWRFELFWKLHDIITERLRNGIMPGKEAVGAIPAEGPRYVSVFANGGVDFGDILENSRADQKRQGGVIIDLNTLTDANLVQPETVERTVWVNVHRYVPECSVHTSRGFADKAQHAADRIACVPVTFREGEGLEGRT